MPCFCYCRCLSVPNINLRRRFAPPRPSAGAVRVGTNRRRREQSELCRLSVTELTTTRRYAPLWKSRHRPSGGHRLFHRLRGYGQFGHSLPSSAERLERRQNAPTAPREPHCLIAAQPRISQAHRHRCHCELPGLIDRPKRPDTVIQARSVPMGIPSHHPDRMRPKARSSLSHGAAATFSTSSPAQPDLSANAIAPHAATPHTNSHRLSARPNSPTARPTTTRPLSSLPLLSVMNVRVATP